MNLTVMVYGGAMYEIVSPVHLVVFDFCSNVLVKSVNKSAVKVITIQIKSKQMRIFRFCFFKSGEK